MGKLLKQKLPKLLAMTLIVASMVTATFADFTFDDAINLFFEDCSVTWANSFIETYSESEYERLSDAKKDKLGAEVETTDSETCPCGKLHFWKSTELDKVEKTFIAKAKQQRKNNNVQEDLGNMTADVGIQADTQLGTEVIAGFVEPINVILGVIVVLITVGLAIFTTFDVCYIVFPVFRNKCEDAKVSGNGPMVKPTANGGTKLRFVSDEAQFVVENCNVSQGKSPLTAYLGKRVWAYIVVSIILFILLTGNINIITNIALKVVSYIMEVLATLG